MKLKHLSPLPLLTAIAIVVGTTAADGESTPSSSQNFFCQTNESTPITAVKTSTGEMQPIFHWKSEALPVNSNPEELCNAVSQQLENYVDSQDNLSTLGFKSTNIDNIPAICATGKENKCQAVLLSFSPVEQPAQTASLILDLILDPQLQANKMASRDRGVQSFSYQVNIWGLLGFRSF